MENSPLYLSYFGVQPRHLKEIEQNLYNELKPVEAISIEDFYQSLNNRLFTTGKKSFVSFLTRERRKALKQMDANFGNSEASYVCGVDFQIYSLILVKMKGNLPDKENRLKEISENYSLQYYTDPNNIPNQQLVKDTISYFESGPGARIFTSLELLNLLEKQRKFVSSNVQGKDYVIQSLESLPLSALEKHVLYGLILKWSGGYPVNMPSEESDVVYKEIQKFFLSFQGETPEKEFCKTDMNAQKNFIKLGVAFSTAINHDVPVKDVWNALNHDTTDRKTFNSFQELLQEAINLQLLPKQKEGMQFVTFQSLHEYQFRAWLFENKWKESGHDDFPKNLTIDIFKKFLVHHTAEKNAEIFLRNDSIHNAYRTFQDNFNKLRDKFRVKKVATKEDCRKIPRLKEGDVISFDPDYKTTIEAYSLLTKYYAAGYCELEKFLFVEKYRTYNAHTINAEIEEIESFIKKAEQTSLSEACIKYGKYDGDREDYVYKRFTSGFYENLEIENYPIISTVGSIEAHVYGKYFLFNEYLKNLVKKRSVNMNTSNASSSERDFEREFKTTEFPFKTMIENNDGFKTALYKEFLEAPTKASLQLYYYKKYTPEQIEQGLLEANRNIPITISRSNQPVAANFVAHTAFEKDILELSHEFYEKLANNEIDVKYFCHDLDATISVKTLKKISKAFDDFKRTISLDSTTDIVTEASVVAKTITSSIKHLVIPGLGKEIINLIVNDNDNIYLVLSKDENQNHRHRYDRMKMHLDDKLKEFLNVDSIPDGKHVSNGLPNSVFISYNHADKKIADQLKRLLKKNGIDVIIDSEAMLIGESIDTFIDASVKKTGITLAVVSRRSLLSGWVARETINTLFLEKFFSDKRFIAVYLDKCFFEKGFAAEVVKNIDQRLDEINAQIAEHAQLFTDTRHLNSEKSKLLALRTNIDDIINRLIGSLCLDLTNEKIAKAFPKLLQAIKSTEPSL